MGDGGIPYLQETYIRDPISAGNLDTGGSHICKKNTWGNPISAAKPRWGDPISAANLDGGGGGGDSVPTGSQMWNPISEGNLNGRGGGGDSISAGNPDGWDPISAGNLHGGRGLIPYLQETFDGGGFPYLHETGGGGGTHICRKPKWGDPISARNLDGGGGSHICRKPRWWGIPYLQET